MPSHLRYSATAKTASGDPSRPVLEMTFRGHRRGICCAAFQSTDPRGARSANAMPPRLLTGGADGAVMLWDARPTCRALRFVGHRGPVLGCDYAPAPAGCPAVTLLASCGIDGYARLWVPNLRRTSTTYPASYTIAPSNSSHRRVDREGVVWRAHTGAARVIKFAQDGSSHLYTAGDDKSVKVWDLNYAATGSNYVGGEPLVTLHGARFLGSFSAAGRAGTSTGTRDYAPAGSHANWVHCLAVQHATRASGSAHYLASGGDDCAVLVWDRRSPHAGPAHAFLQHRTPIRGLSFHDNGHLLASCDLGGCINVYDLRRASSSPSSGLTTTTMSAPHRYGLVQHYAESHGGGGVAVNDVCFAPGSGGWLLSAGDDGTAKLWDTVEGFLYCTVQAHEGAVRTARFSDDGRFFTTAAADGIAMVWRSGLPHMTPVGPCSPASTPHAVHTYEFDDQEEEEEEVQQRSQSQRQQVGEAVARNGNGTAPARPVVARPPAGERARRQAPHMAGAVEDTSYTDWQRNLLRADPTVATTARHTRAEPTSATTTSTLSPLARVGSGAGPSAPPTVAVPSPVSGRPPRAPPPPPPPATAAGTPPAAARERSFERSEAQYSGIASPQAAEERRRQEGGVSVDGSSHSAAAAGSDAASDCQQQQQPHAEEGPRGSPSGGLMDRRLENMENAVTALMEYVQEENVHRDQELERISAELDQQSVRQREEITVLKTLMEKLLSQQAALFERMTNDKATEVEGESRNGGGDVAAAAATAAHEDAPAE